MVRGISMMTKWKIFMKANTIYILTFFIIGISRSSKNSENVSSIFDRKLMCPGKSMFVDFFGHYYNFT